MYGHENSLPHTETARNPFNWGNGKREGSGILTGWKAMSHFALFCAKMGETTNTVANAARRRGAGDEAARKRDATDKTARRRDAGGKATETLLCERRYHGS